MDSHNTKMPTSAIYFPTNQPEEENPGLSLSQCILTCHMKKNCKMVIYDKKIQDCGLISKYYKQKDLAKCKEQVQILRSDILAYEV